MKVKDVLKIACTYLQLNDCLNASVLDGANTTPSSATNDDINLLIKSLNFVIDEIARENFNLVYQENITISGENFSLSSLSKNAIFVKIIETTYGASINFEIVTGFIKASNGNYKISYIYSPESVDDCEDDINNFCGNVSTRIFAYGVCREYCLITGLFNEASMWDERFSSAIKKVNMPKNNIVLKQRRWI